MNCLVYRCCCIYLYQCAPYYFSTGQIIPYQLHQVATTSTVSEAHRVLPGSRRWRKLEKSIGKKKKNENASILQLISFQRKTGAENGLYQFSTTF